MANGKNHGGARPGSGRKTKAEILGLAELIDEAWPPADQKAVIRKLARDCNNPSFAVRHPARILLLSYKFGKPTEKHELTGAEGRDLIPTAFTVEIVNGTNGTTDENKDK